MLSHPTCRGVGLVAAIAPGLGDVRARRRGAREDRVRARRLGRRGRRRRDPDGAVQAQFRPGAPPSLTSDVWKRDLDEIKALGARSSTQRTAEQTAMARFWEATAPAIYWPVARSVAGTPGRDVADSARLLALAAMAMDDARIYDGVHYRYSTEVGAPMGRLVGDLTVRQIPGPAR